jgi:glycosyltransferase involved in cell wall biosynthesis
VTSTLAAGGAERALSSIANYWSRSGHRVVLVTVAGRESGDFYALDPGVVREWLTQAPVSSRRRSSWLENVRRVRRLRSILRRERPAAALSFIDVPNILTILAATGLPMKVVVSERACGPHPALGSGLYPLARPWKILRRFLYRRADATSVLNEEAVRWLRRECHVLPQIVPLALRELPPPPPDALRGTTVVGIGRFHRVKGFDVLIDAFARVASEFPLWTLTLIGDGPCKSQLLAQSQTAGLADRIRFIDPVSNVEEWFSGAGVVVSASRQEAFGNALLEAMAMGAPVISTRCDGPVLFVQDGIDGRLVPIDDAAALATALRELMSDRTLRDSLGRQAVKVRQRFRETDVMKLWESLLFER